MNILERLKAGVNTRSAAETQDLAGALAEVLPANVVLALEGDLGAGKTTFVGGLARKWDITEPITSPTYNLFSIYKGTCMLAHLDAYRLQSSADMDALMLDEFLVPPYCLAVEWPSRISDWLPEDTLWLTFSTRPGMPHQIRLI